MTITEHLVAARALIALPERWGRGFYSFNPRYWYQKPLCAAGACLKTAPRRRSEEMYSAAHDALVAAIPPTFKDAHDADSDGTYLPMFNDDPETTHADIMALFDRAIAAQDVTP